MTEQFIPLASPDIRLSDVQRVSEVLMTGMLIQGKNVLELENKFAAVTQTEEGIAVSNGTASMHLLLKALGVGKGDEVIVPAFSYVATANVVELVGATPVFVDIELRTFNIDVKKVEEKITAKTKAIIPVHEFGLACNIEGIMKIAKKHNLYVIEDAACALGAKQNGKPVGSFGNGGSFSLHPRKSITCGEGGMITLNDKRLANKLRQLRNHGIDIVGGKMIFEEAGFNYRMTDFQAALACSQMERLDEVFEKRRQLSEIYFNEIKSERVLLPLIPAGRNHTWQTFHILIDENSEQQEIIGKFRSLGIGTNYGAQCIPAQKYYMGKYKQDAKMLYPNAYKAYKQGIAIPLYEKLNKDQIYYISKAVNSVC